MDTIQKFLTALLAVMLAGCGTVGYTPEQRLERNRVGTNRDLFVAVSTTPIDFKLCNTRVFTAADLQIYEPSALSVILSQACSGQDLVLVRGFLRHHFTNGAILAIGYAPRSMSVMKGDIVESMVTFSPNGYQTGLPMITRIIRRDAFNTKDPSCYWDGGNSGVGTAFANGGVVCPAENYDWRNQKWAELR